MDTSNLDDKTLSRLLENLRRLTHPRTPVDLLQDATGLFAPGFTALPAVMLVSAKPPRAETLAEEAEFKLGRLYAFEVIDSTCPAHERVRTFFSPMDNVRIPPVRFSLASSGRPFECVLRVESKVELSNMDFYFAWLPWGKQSLSVNEKVNTLTKILNLGDFLPGILKVDLQVDDYEIPLSIHPKWGLDTWVPTPEIESIIFPISYARRLISPLVFRLKLPEAYSKGNGRSVRLNQKELTLSFSISEENLRRLYSKAGISFSELQGFTIVENAVPMMNIDIKAWEPTLSYDEFARTSDMKPLGFAGIMSFKVRTRDTLGKEEHKPDRPWLLPYSTQIAIRYDRDGRLTSYLTKLGSSEEDKEKQLFFWMTYGARLNGLSFQYPRDTDSQEPVQPMQVKSDCLRQVDTAIPCIGGYDCQAIHTPDLYGSLMLNFAAPTQMLVSKDALVFGLEDLLNRLGYKGYTIQEPFVELRVVEGCRQRVIVIHVEKVTLEQHHKEAIQDYIDQLTPIGSKIMIDFCG